MNYVVHFGRSKKIVFVLKYKISSTPIDVPQTTTTPWRGGGDTNKQTNKLGGGWQVYNEKIMCIQRVTMRPLIAKTNVLFCKDYSFLWADGITFLWTPYLFTWAAHEGQGPGWQSKVQRWVQSGCRPARERPQTCPHVCATSIRFHSGSQTFPQKQRYSWGILHVTFWHAGHRQPDSRNRNWKLQTN